MQADTPKDEASPNFEGEPLSSVIDSVENFILNNLPAFGKEVNLSRETYFNSKLILHFNTVGKREENEFIFGDVAHERTLTSEDVGVYSKGGNINREPFYVLECKRLPTPPGRSETEYVKGRDDENEGGIERFKQKRHGADLEKSGMIGYVEENDFNHWHQKINSWILELVENNSDSTINWKKTEILSQQIETDNVSKCNSIHTILKTDDTIELTHFWVKLSSEN